MIAQVFCQFNHKQGVAAGMLGEILDKAVVHTRGLAPQVLRHETTTVLLSCGIEINGAGRDILSEMVTGKIRLVCALPDCEGGDKEDFLATGLVDYPAQ